VTPEQLQQSWALCKPVDGQVDDQIASAVQKLQADKAVNEQVLKNAEICKEVFRDVFKEEMSLLSAQIDEMKNHLSTKIDQADHKMEIMHDDVQKVDKKVDMIAKQMAEQQQPTSPTWDFYILIQKAVTEMVDYDSMALHQKAMKSWQAHLSKWEKSDSNCQRKRSSVCLSDGSSGLQVKKHLQNRGMKCMIWCGTGVDARQGGSPNSESEEDHPFSLQVLRDQDRKIEWLPSWPKVVVICMEHGSSILAKTLHDAGAASVLWICGKIEEEEPERLVQQLVDALGGRSPWKDILDILKQEDVEEKYRLRWDLLGKEFIEVEENLVHDGTHDQLDICYREQCENNLLEDLHDLDVQMLTCDIDTMTTVQKRLDGWARTSKTSTAFLLQGGEKGDDWKDVCVQRCRAVACGVCKSALLSRPCQYDRVFRISEQAQLKKICELCKEHPNVREQRVLVWFDMQKTKKLSAEHVLEWLQGRDFRTLAVITCSDSEGLNMIMEEMEHCIGDAMSIDDEVDESDMVEMGGLHSGLRLVPQHAWHRSALKCNSDRLAEILARELPSLSYQKGNASEQHSPKRPIQGVYAEEDGAMFVRIWVPEVRDLHKLRNALLASTNLTASGCNLAEQLAANGMEVDRSDFAELYLQNCLQIKGATVPQRQIINGCWEFLKNASPIDQSRMLAIIKATAGAGKTFAGATIIIKKLEMCKDSDVLFVCNTEALALFMLKWIGERYPGTARKKKEALLRVHVMFSPWDAVHKLSKKELTGNAGRLELIEEKPKRQYGMLVMDEAHHILIDEATRDKCFQTKLVSEETDLLVLSDLSQSNTDSPLCLPQVLQGISPMHLTQVVRSTQRIVSGAMAFQVSDSHLDKENTQCYDQTQCAGPPLRPFIFKARGSNTSELFGQYVDETMGAFQAITEEFPTMCLHGKVAVLTPTDQSFMNGLRAALAPRLQEKYAIELVGAADAMRDTEFGSSSSRKSTVIFESVPGFDGLESLFVIAVGLDRPIEGGQATLETRSLFFRAITRAQLMFMIVNEAIPGGFLQFLGHIHFENKEFSQQKELERSDSKAAEDIVNKAAKELETHDSESDSVTEHHINEHSHTLDNMPPSRDKVDRKISEGATSAEVKSSDPEVTNDIVNKGVASAEVKSSDPEVTNDIVDKGVASAEVKSSDPEVANDIVNKGVASAEVKSSDPEVANDIVDKGVASAEVKSSDPEEAEDNVRKKSRPQNIWEVNANHRKVLHDETPLFMPFQEVAKDEVAVCWRLKLILVTFKYHLGQGEVPPLFYSIVDDGLMFAWM